MVDVCILHNSYGDDVTVKINRYSAKLCWLIGHDDNRIIDFSHRVINHSGVNYYILFVRFIIGATHKECGSTYIIEEDADGLSVAKVCDDDLFGGDISFVCGGNYIMLNGSAGIGCVWKKSIGLAGERLHNAFFISETNRELYDICVLKKLIFVRRRAYDEYGYVFSSSVNRHHVFVRDNDGYVVAVSCDERYKEKASPTYIFKKVGDTLSLIFKRSIRYPFVNPRVDVDESSDGSLFIALNCLEPHDMKHDCVFIYREKDGRFVHCQMVSFVRLQNGLCVVLNPKNGQMIIYNSDVYIIFQLGNIKTMYMSHPSSDIQYIYLSESDLHCYRNYISIRICLENGQIRLKIIQLNGSIDEKYIDVMKYAIETSYDVSEEEGFKEAYKLLAKFGGLMDSKYILE